MTAFFEQRPGVVDNAAGERIEARGAVVGEHDEPCIEIAAYCGDTRAAAVRMPIDVAETFAQSLLALIDAERPQRRRRRRGGTT